MQGNLICSALRTVLFFHASPFSECRVQNFFADTQVLWGDFEQLIGINEVERLLKT